MLSYPQIDPVILDIWGPISIRWYGLMYLVGFAAAWVMARARVARLGGTVAAKDVDDLIFYAAMGVVLGGRVGYVLFYNFSTFLENPAILLRIWEGGMSFHGGLLGVLLAMAMFARRLKIAFWDLMDFVAPLVPIGLGAGRMGNFINGELWGRATDVPWAMIFPTDALQLPRHPSQLYELFFEGAVLFVMLYFFSQKPKPRYAVSGMFALGYGAFRFGVEFFREPDADKGYYLGWMTMGQILSTPLMMVGVLLLLLAFRSSQPKALS
jgi:phosphatidylglycerol---prolipoprotein diacylglyceryl transferase